MSVETDDETGWNAQTGEAAERGHLVQLKTAS
jgi:hypothetical protein